MRKSQEVQEENNDLLKRAQTDITRATKSDIKEALTGMLKELDVATTEQGLCSQIENRGDYELNSAILKFAFAHWGAKRQDLCLVYPVLGGAEAYDEYCYRSTSRGELDDVSLKDHRSSRLNLKMYLIKTFSEQLAYLITLSDRHGIKRG